MTIEPISGYRVGADREPTKNPVDKHRQTPEEAEALKELHLGVLEQGSNCQDKPEVWADLEHDVAEWEADLLCAGCPVFDLCKKYDDLAQPKFGIWAGKKRGEELI